MGGEISRKNAEVGLKVQRGAIVVIPFHHPSNPGFTAEERSPRPPVVPDAHIWVNRSIKRRHRCINSARSASRYIKGKGQQGIRRHGTETQSSVTPLDGLGIRNVGGCDGYARR